MKTPLEQLADHEAGHATVALALGVAVASIQLYRRPEGGFVGVTLLQDGPRPPLLVCAAISWGGYLASPFTNAEHDYVYLRSIGHCDNEGPAIELAEQTYHAHVGLHRQLADALCREYRLDGAQLAELIGPVSL